MTDRYHLGDYAQVVSEAADRLDAESVPARLHAHDYTLWSDDPTEISDRLAWLTLPTDMATQVADLCRFGTTLRDEGCRHVVLLGMGGSSLGPEVIRQTIGNSAGYPQMLTLDSTVPDWVVATTVAIDPTRTVFVLSSKSGTTTEPNAFYAYFRDLMAGQVGVNDAGRHFLAITDPETALVRLAQTGGFRRVFLNDQNIGGRYSVLSHFGLVPAALTGVDLERLLDSAQRMQRRCLGAGQVRDNPGAWLGTVIGALVKAGRNKLTLIASDSIAGFGLWVEQLLAESTGKNGTGVVPVAGEPQMEPVFYGDDRLFVQLRLASDDNADADALASALSSAGHPVVQLEMLDGYDLGAEFYRWEYATAIVGQILGIHPFDQPDVQGAKDQTVSVLDQYQRDGSLPRPQPEKFGQLAHLLENSRAGDYLAVMAYLPDSPATRLELNAVRERVLRKYRIATTVGYGPRFLHSTGQLHKGGPASGIFLQLTQQRSHDLPIPGWPFSFGVLADAQALGDFQALQALGRRTMSLRLAGDPAEEIRRLVDLV